MNSNTPCPITRSNKKYLNNRINYIEKKQDIYMENKAMFDRLLNISQQSIVNYIQKLKKGRSASFKSIYEILRKNKEKKIAVENAQIVKKLLSTKPFLPKKSLDKEYFEYKQRKKRLARLAPIDIGKSYDNQKLNNVVMT